MLQDRQPRHAQKSRLTQPGGGRPKTPREEEETKTGTRPGQEPSGAGVRWRWAAALIGRAGGLCLCAKVGRVALIRLSLSCRGIPAY
jgi:hypothetical protein